MIQQTVCAVAAAGFPEAILDYYQRRSSSRDLETASEVAEAAGAGRAAGSHTAPAIGLAAFLLLREHPMR